MTKYDPERMELSTRDRVALASDTEIMEGRGTANGGVWLDVSDLPRETIMKRLPRVYNTLIELQMVDITTSPIEVAPTAHYSMGGVWVRPEDHSTDVPGLYAVGEASSGLHGANRLGGSLPHRIAGRRTDCGQGSRRILRDAVCPESIHRGRQRGQTGSRRPTRRRRGGKRASAAACHPKHHDGTGWRRTYRGGTVTRVNLVWSPSRGIEREPIPPVPDYMESLMRGVVTSAE